MLGGLLLIVATTLAAAPPESLLVEGDTGLIVGGFRGGKWLENEPAGKAAPGGLDFRLYDLTHPRGSAKGAKPASLGEPCPELLAITLQPTPSPESRDLFAIHSSWNPQPRTPRLADTTQDVYRAAVREVLTSHGIREPKVKITQILRIDLDGDGSEEVLVSATNYFEPDESAPTASRAGTYSFVMLRQEVGGKVRTRVVAGEFYPKKQVFNAPNVYRVGGLLDLDGDGRLEIIVRSGYYEGGGTLVFRLGSGRLEKVLEIGCGA